MSKLRRAVVKAIRLVQQQIRWKPGKDSEHLQKRIRLGHLDPGATIADYESIIAAVVTNAAADVFVFVFDDTVYPTTVADCAGQRWLVMFDLNGMMETAFPPEDPVQYLSDPRFLYLGSLQELVQ